MTGEFHAQFPNTRRAAALARRSLVAHIAAYGFSGQELCDIETAVGEALANAAEHGRRGGRGFEVRAFIDRDRVVIEVQDGGFGFASAGEPAAKPGQDALRGFGIYLMRHLMDEVDFTRQGTCVRLTKRLPDGLRRSGSANRN